MQRGNRSQDVGLVVETIGAGDGTVLTDLHAELGAKNQVGEETENADRRLGRSHGQQYHETLPKTLAIGAIYAEQEIRHNYQNLLQSPPEGFAGATDITSELNRLVAT